MAKRNLASHFHPRWMMVALLSLIAVIGLTHIPQEVLSRVVRFDPFDKAEHVVAYGVVAAFLFLSLRRPVPAWLLLAMLAALAVIGALDEITQPLVNRHASVFDYAADLVGVGLACPVLWVRRWCDPVRRATASLPEG